MRLVWARYALSDRENIFTYIEIENPRAAVHVDQKIVLAVRRLVEFPESGRPGRIAGTRELVIPSTPYIAAYVVHEDRIRILRVLHGAQIWPDAISTD
ncbi:type II toxin-antitoxin system mRNA interferase toxin, RelE/StbE family [Rhizobium johnstonii]|uniref:Type II toxin-antitoxin system mRNA interferase toxin, RelE/StbE family n=2 Tax=Rhizobium TaxID=379 RepID=A0A6N9ZJH5_9HYPH|nr:MULTISPECIES: type II toxin-antitoxin system mRNA interferase toxin, RelE/StbE family [Rhizobium]NEH93145.1 type II toxin-antitoxin system mRNA interferase toxin, RelE/StbE family [Rhizobium laguerreae]MBY5318722.1 type II toxin-antitoxin system mRNA interferase toxin, RelE/StbE family [Rhizobium leguminosarum]MBY5339050.1 type II toxin-antitoxin system mRNA interferase toxin, RelE/StbE family [Rhizobium leguminosarum]MBY5371892.1 type II toxin-antitoxin system mRNA interferase toxin, RelE/S